jgi:hypothetical protein
LFLVEILIGGVLPASLLLAPKIRRSPEGLITCALLAIFGVISQRMSLSMFTMFRPEGASYIPSGFEIIIAFAIPAAAALVYLFFCENLAVFQDQLPVRKRDPYAKPEFSWNTLVHRDGTIRNALLRRSGIGVILVAFTVAALPLGIVSGEQMLPTPVRGALGWENLVIDGNRSGEPVHFPHVEHQDRLLEEYANGDEACLACHHLSKPNDEVSPCWECHQDMFLPTSLFDHTLHQTELGGNAACTECHVGEHTRDSAKPCVECHDTMSPRTGETRFNYLAPGYKQAMHGACITCHQQEASAQNRPDLSQCPICHYPENTPSPSY